MNTKCVVRFRKPSLCSSRNLFRLIIVLSLAFTIASKASAQYGGGGGTSGGSGGSGSGGTYTPPKGGYSSATGAGIGAGAAAGATGLFLALHYRGRVTGCVQPGEDGLRLLDERKNKSYALVPGDVYVKPGQRVQLKGQKSKNDAGDQTFKLENSSKISAPAVQRHLRLQKRRVADNPAGAPFL